MDEIYPRVIGFATILLSVFVYAKVLGYTKQSIKIYVLGAAFSFVLAIYIYLLGGIIPSARFALMILVLAVFLAIITKTELLLAFTATIVSIGISYGLIFVSVTISTTIIHIIFGDERLILTTTVAVVLQSISVYCLFRIKRFSKGIPFLKKKAARVIGCLISGAIILTFLIINRGISKETGGWVIAGTALCGIGLIHWWRQGLTKQYLEKVRERNNQELERLIGEKDVQIKKLQEDNEMMARIIHRDNKILPAMIENVLLYMRSDKNILSNGRQILEQVEQLIEERTEVLTRELNKNAIRESQYNPVIDGVIRHMMMRASAEGVQFEIAEMSNVVKLSESTIQPIKLQTLLVDLIENAINATAGSDIKHILISFSEDDGIFEISVHDSGVCFDPETLLCLGKKKITTRINDGGSGIGYMEIFKILNESNAGLTITEFEPEQSHFTKSISIRFDDKAEHILQTYRAEIIMGFCSGEASIPLLKIISSKAR